MTIILFLQIKRTLTWHYQLMLSAGVWYAETQGLLDKIFGVTSVMPQMVQILAKTPMGPWTVTKFLTAQLGPSPHSPRGHTAIVLQQLSTEYQWLLFRTHLVFVNKVYGLHLKIKNKQQQHSLNKIPFSKTCTLPAHALYINYTMLCMRLIQYKLRSILIYVALKWWPSYTRCTLRHHTTIYINSLIAEIRNDRL